MTDVPIEEDLEVLEESFASPAAQDRFSVGFGTAAGDDDGDSDRDDLDEFDSSVFTSPAFEDDEEFSSLACFDGDIGTLDLAQRYCLVTLLKKPFISADRDGRAWQVLTANEPTIRSMMHNLLLDIEINRDHQVAYKRQVRRDDGGDGWPVLLTDAAFTREETAVLILLRQRLYRSAGEGATAHIDQQELLDAIADMRPESATNLASNVNKVLNAIERFRKIGVLTASARDEFVINPVLNVLMPVEVLHDLLTWLRTANGTDPASVRGSQTDLLAEETTDDD